MDVAVDQVVTAAFDELLDPATVTGASFTLVPDGGAAVPATVTLDSTGLVATLVPDTLLAYGMLHAAHLATTITDTLGNPLATEEVWSFTTVAPPDTTSPTVLATVPDAGALGVSVDGTLSATFDEDMDPATLTTTSFTLVPDGGSTFMLPRLVGWGRAMELSLLAERLPQNRGFQRFMETLPGTILLSLVAPGIFSAGLLGGVAALATALCAWKTRNVLAAMIVGMGIVAAGRMLHLS